MFSGQCRQRRRRHWPVVEYLVRDAKADIHHQDHDRWTVLHNACSSGHGPMVEFLVEQGADVNMPNRMGHTPLINAASRGHVSIVEYLLEKAKANPLWVNLSGETAYDAAATARHFYLCEILEQNEKAWWTGSRDKCGPWSVPGGGPQNPGQVEVPTGWRWAMSEWEIDHSKPRMDKEGWEYARTFGASDWSAQEPSSGTHWVRRRRWARMMNRLDMDRQDSESEECPQSVSNPLRWQKDDEVLECCCCERVFGFFLRKHHCRQCGMIVCDKCSGQRWPLSSPVQVPYTTTVNKTQQGGLQRVCDRCALKRQSVLVDCPVCENSLYGLGKEERERHLEECLSTAQRPKPGEHVGKSF
ncbi:ankyrin repeat-containing domain protein [Phycomyces blakesleeanus]